MVKKREEEAKKISPLAPFGLATALCKILQVALFQDKYGHYLFFLNLATMLLFNPLLCCDT
jgi:hypothetical protein